MSPLPLLKVCDLYCDGGVDMDKWRDAQVGHYIGIGRLLRYPIVSCLGCRHADFISRPIPVTDVSASVVSDAHEPWESKRKPFTAEFIELDPSDVRRPVLHSFLLTRADWQEVFRADNWLNCDGFVARVASKLRCRKSASRRMLFVVCNTCRQVACPQILKRCILVILE
jgi:hypothetical protein